MDIMKVAKANFTRITVARTNDTTETLWNIINGERGEKSANNTSLLYRNQKLMCPQGICNIFNSTFLDNVDILACNNYPTNLTSNNKTHSIRGSFYLPEVTEEDLVRIICNLKSKKSFWVDGITAFSTKKMSPIYNKEYT
jgi:hypothetical protein